MAEFDGEDWARGEENLQPVPLGRVPSYEPPAPGRTNLTQRFHITGLGDELLPAAATPTYLSFGDDEEKETEDLAVDTETGELQVEGGLTEGLDYEVHSDVPDATFERLERAQIGDPGPVYREVPQGVSEEVYALADRWTEGQSTPFDQLVAIQDRLRDFEYSLDVKPEDSSDYLTQFLTETKAGYCQQFATAFALLARVQGFPARVSVGFLPGATSATPGTRVVTGNDAHAWPEVYFERFGWVPFEPTPRADVGEPDHTIAGLVPGGAGGAGGAPRGQGPTGRGFSNNPSICSRGPGAPAAGLACGDGQRGVAFTPPTDPRAVPVEEPPWVEAFDRLARVVVALAVLFLLGVPLLKELRVRRRYRKASDAAGRARAAFAQFLSDAAELAAPRRRSESAAAYARRLVAANRVPRRATLALVELYETAEYGRGGMSPQEAEEARRVAGRRRGALWSSASWWQRAVRLFGAATLLGPRRAGAVLPLRRRLALAGASLRATRAG